MGCFRGLFALVVIVILGGVIVGVVSNQAPRPAAVAQVSAPTLDKSPEMQADRKQLIERLMGEGVFQKIEVPGDLPRLWVRPAFYALDFATKQKFVSVVYAYYFDGSSQIDTVRIFDNRTGNEVGTYAEVQGGLKLN